jgi:4-hydroxy-4-methyl-2-oxoglutarate aldolase
MSTAPTLDAELLSRASRRSAATLHEAAGKLGALPPVIQPFAADVQLCGPAFPVQSPSGDNLWLHHAIYAAQPGDVLVVDVGSNPEFGYWGEVMALAAQTRGIAGLVINGGVRDVQRMLVMRFPVFAASACIRGTGKNVHGQGSLGSSVTMGDVTVNRGDLVVGDFDGLVVLPAARAAEIVAAGERRDAEEDGIFRRLRAGDRTLEIYHLAIPDLLKAGQ